MSRNLLNKYIWLLETIERHGRLSRAELNDLWLASDISGGEPLARRTFYNGSRKDRTYRPLSRWRGAHSTTTATA